MGNGIIRTYGFAFTTLDTFGLVDDRMTILHGNRTTGTYLITGMRQTAHTFILTKSEQADVSVKTDIKKILFRLAPQALILESFHSPSLLVPFNKWKKGIKEDCLSCQKGRRTFILSGIGNPEAFKETTLEAGLNPVGSMFFPDHHVYTSADMESAEMAAAYSGADLITVTEKDAVKMLNLSKAEDSKIPLYVLEIEMKFAENGEAQLQEQWEVFL